MVQELRCEGGGGLISPLLPPLPHDTSLNLYFFLPYHIPLTSFHQKKSDCLAVSYQMVGELGPKSYGMDCMEQRFMSLIHCLNSCPYQPKSSKFMKNCDTFSFLFKSCIGETLNLLVSVKVAPIPN